MSNHNAGADHATRIAAAAAEIADGYADIESEAMQAAQMAQDIEAGEQILRERIADILSRHFPEPPDWCDRPTVAGDWRMQSKQSSLSIVEKFSEDEVKFMSDGMAALYDWYGPIPPRPEEKEDAIHD